MGAHRYADHPPLEHMDFVGDEGVRYWDTFCGEGPHLKGWMLHYVLERSLWDDALSRECVGAPEAVTRAAKKAQSLGYITGVHEFDLYIMKKKG